MSIGNIRFNPNFVSNNTRVNTDIFSMCTSNAETYHTDKHPTLIINERHQWSTWITLARIFDVEWKKQRLRVTIFRSISTLDMKHVRTFTTIIDASTQLHTPVIDQRLTSRRIFVHYVQFHLLKILGQWSIFEQLTPTDCHHLDIRRQCASTRVNETQLTDVLIGVHDSMSLRVVFNDGRQIAANDGSVIFNGYCSFNKAISLTNVSLLNCACTIICAIVLVCVPNPRRSEPA
jgi:hypothetical protein